MIRYKRTKKIIIAINNIQKKNLLLYNKDEKVFIYCTTPTIRVRASRICNKATCKRTSANITKGKYNVKKKIY